MNYSIGESRLKQLIDNYITQRVGSFTEKRRIDSDGATEYTWWEDENGDAMFENEVGYSVGVYEGLWLLIKDLFNLDPMDVDEAILRWVHHHLGLEIEILYTFEL